jgi:hypothetical protein
MTLPLPQDKHFQWAIGEAVEALPKSLRFSNDIYYYWRHRDHSSVGDHRPRPELGRPIVERARTLFENSPDTFIRVIDPRYMYVAHRFWYFHSEGTESGAGRNSEEWQWLASLLVEAASQSPEVVLPQVIPFVVDSQMGHNEFIHQINIEGASAFFRERLFDVMLQLSGDWKVGDFDANEVERIEFAKKAASEWLKNPTNH